MSAGNTSIFHKFDRRRGRVRGAQMRTKMKGSPRENPGPPGKFPALLRRRNSTQPVVLAGWESGCEGSRKSRAVISDSVSGVCQNRHKTV